MERQRDIDAGRPPRVYPQKETFMAMEIEYSDGILHVPLDKSFRLSRYRSADAIVKPKLSRMRSGSWGKQRDRVKGMTEDIAVDVLAAYVRREKTKRMPYRLDLEAGMENFERGFVWEETEDQLKAITQIRDDMVWRGKPMDRLVAGDVGFGKTEVAMRALFRACINSRQAVLLAPTSVLASQHYKNVVKRFNGTGVVVKLLRGGIGKEREEVKAGLKNGTVGLVVGTHAILGKGVEFRNLGLVVIDEEQRFGVKQKERLKVISSGVDVLTLSATPIPRTLQMSLSGVRDTTTIRTPPKGRVPVKTTVEETSHAKIGEAIKKELDRGGQAFVVVPRIGMIDGALEMLEEEIPGVRIVVAHGKMGRGQAEENVSHFAAGKADVLLATTVIENGIDIPTVNTMIVLRAETFGMSTLYQLRGRVGRSNVQAYAILMYDQGIGGVSEGAMLRLKAMEDLQELGAGFDIASRDLEIRGAGSLFGVEQSGMAGKVGFDLYMRMLRKAIKKLGGLRLPIAGNTDIDLGSGEGSIMGANAFSIPASYISSEEENSRMVGEARLAEDSDELVRLTSEWKEVYGPLPAEMKRPLKDLHLHACTRLLGIDKVRLDKDGTAVLRAPGMRPRHWRMIEEEIKAKGGRSKTGVKKKVKVYFPERMKEAERREENAEAIIGGEVEKNEGDGPMEDEWEDGIEEDEQDGDSSGMRKFLAMGDDDEIPGLRIEGVGDLPVGERAEGLLKLLLPLAKIVKERTKEDDLRTMEQVEKRERREQWENNIKQGGGLKKNRVGYYEQPKKDS